MNNHEHNHERPWMAIIGIALAGICIYLWVVTSVAGFLFGAGWPHVPPESMPWALYDWITHLSDPTAGFPAAVRSRLPGAVGMYVTLVVLTAALGYALFAAKHLLSGLCSLPGRLLDDVWPGAHSAPDVARFATPRDLRELIVPCARPGRLTIGRIGSNLLAAERGHSLMVTGATQTGKTTGLAIPALLEWQGPALVTSVKRDLHDHTHLARSAAGKVWVYEPSPGPGLETCTWNPVEHCTNWQEAERMAHWLMGASQAAPGGREEAKFWANLAEKLMASMLFAAASSGLGMAEVIRWLNLTETAEVDELLKKADDDLACEAWYGSTHRDERMLGSVYASVEAVLAAYGDPAVLDSTVGEGLTGEKLLDSGSGTAYICAPPHEQQRLAPLFAALVSQVVAAAYDRHQATGRPLDPPLLILLDEAGNIAPIPGLSTLASTAVNHGVQLVSVWHDQPQLEAVYGKEAETIINNHRAKLVLGGVGDERTLRWVQNTLGEQRVQQVSHTQDSNRDSHTHSYTYRPLAPPALTRQLASGEGLLVYGNRAPARVKLRPYYADRTLAALAAGEIRQPEPEPAESQPVRGRRWRRPKALRLMRR